MKNEKKAAADLSTLPANGVKKAAELMLANQELSFQNYEKEKKAAELILANEELAFQNNEKEKRAAELIIANKELAFQNNEKENRAAELIIANKELAFQNNEKENRAAELILANEELAFQNNEKEKRAAELIIANKELAFQNNEKENRAAELIIANKELAFQNNEKENRAAELILANKELAFQNNEKENRAAELIIANKELAFQNNEKEKRAAELIIANKELAFQNTEKEKRAAELILINQELSFQIQEKEKRETELLRANKELLAFSHISSHDLQEPLRKIQVFSNRILETESKNLSDLGMGDFQRIQASSARMQQSIKDLLIYSRINTTERKFEEIDLDELTDDIKKELHELILSKKVTIHINASIPVYAILVQFRQLLYNLISNALKFSHPHVLPSIHIKTELISSDDTPAGLLPGKEYSRITVEDNGIGFESKFNERIFGMFQKLHGNEKYAGTGIGLAIVKKIIENHNGTITASGELNKGATFEIHIPAG